ncbi:MAG: DEAD/DEAH box helicase family protein, partial [Desulfobulbaceae bacterium]
MIRLEVAVAAPLWQTLSYLFADDDSGVVPVGKRVLVPLGNRRVTGYVLGLLPEEDVGYKLRPVLEVLDSEPIFPVNLIPFFRWVARYYHYPLGEVIKTALPGGLAPRSGKQLHLTEQGQENLQALLDATGLPEPEWLPRLIEKGSLSAAESPKLLGKNSSRKLIAAWQEQGLVEIREILIGNDVRQKQEICYTFSKDLSLPPCPSPAPSRDEIISFGRGLTDEFGASLHFSHIKTLYFLHMLAGADTQRPVPARELTKAYSGASKALPLLVEQGIVCRIEQRIFRNPYGEQLSWFPRPETLTQEQEQVLVELLPAIEEKKFTTFLLHGVTGGGKTEVYLRAAEATLASGRDVLVLVPEIALATQLEAHFVSRFGDKVLILHSGLSTGERFAQWSLASRGKNIASPQIVIGARSAVFAPLPDPGLIVVDEEHDDSYKAMTRPRYHARDVA